MPEQLDFQKMKTRYQGARTLHESQTAKLATIAAYCRPRDQDYFLSDTYSGDNPEGTLYDYTAPNQLIALTNKAFMTLMPNNANYFTISLTEDALLDESLSDKSKEILEAKLSRITSKLRRFINNSNIRPVFEDSLLNYFTFGYSLIKMTTSTGAKTIEFDSIPNDSFSMEQSPSSKNVSIFMRRKWRVRDWNRENPDKKIDNRDETSFVFIVTGRIYLGVMKEEINQVVKYLPKVAEVVFQEDGDKYISYKEREVETGQLLLGRMQPATGETYPTGVGGRMLPDAQTLNSLRASSLEITQWQGSPMFEASLDADIPKDFEPGSGRILYTDSDTFRNGGGIKPLEVGGNAGAVLAAINDTTQRIMDTLKLVPSTSEVPQFRTATEWALQQGREEESVGPLIDSAKQELLMPLIRYCLFYAQQMDYIDEKLELDGQFYTLRVTGAEEERDKLSKLRKLEALDERTAIMLQTNPNAVFANIDDDKRMQLIISALDLHQIKRSAEAKEAFEDGVLQAQQPQQE